VGRWAFRHLDLMVDRRVLIPRPETEVVAGLAIDEVVARSGSGRDVVVADLGTGSGAIAFAIATECTSSRVLATDRSADALAVARANLTGLGRAAGRVSLHEGSWFAALPDSVRGAIDVLVSNPPYIGDDEDLPSVVGDWEPRGALRAGPVGDEDLQTIIGGAEEWVAPGGAVVLEMAPDQTAPIADRFRAVGWQASVHADLAGRDRAVVARKRS
ncbi:MAG: HemK/PrmC family methyltransferase, partial [Actinomycetota bacterium]